MKKTTILLIAALLTVSGIAQDYSEKIEKSSVRPVKVWYNDGVDGYEAAYTLEITDIKRRTVIVEWRGYKYHLPNIESKTLRIGDEFKVKKSKIHDRSLKWTDIDKYIGNRNYEQRDSTKT